MTTYVIRENSFFYDDSYDAYEGSRIASYFTDRAAAEAEYKRLEIEATRYIILWNQETLWNAQEAFEPELKFLKELDTFVFSCCGQHLLEDGKLKIELPENMQDDDIFEFVQRAGIQKYDILVFENEPLFYGVWLHHQQEWLKRNQETGCYLMYDLSEEKLFDKLQDGYYMPFGEHDFIYVGELTEISDSPTLLKTQIDELYWVKYNIEQKKLYISPSDVLGIRSLNPLLKQPIFTVKPLSLADILSIEKKIRAEEQQKYEQWEAEYRARLVKNNPPLES